jgi:oligoendopeptidase F
MPSHRCPGPIPSLCIAFVCMNLATGSVAQASGGAARPDVASTAANAAAPGGPATSWDLTDLYPTSEAWDEALARTQSRAEDLARYRGTLSAGPADMLAALAAISDARREANRLLAYAMLKSDEDLRVAANLERKQLARSLRTKIAEKTAWLAPEMLEMGADKIHEFRSQNPTLDQRFGFYLDDKLRAAPHTLGAEAEGVLAAAGTLLAQPSSVHATIADAEFPAPTITLADGSSARLDEPGYEKYRQASDRTDRRIVFDAYWGAWKKQESTAGLLLATYLMGDHFVANSRHFPSDLAAAQFDDDMPRAVYDTLIAETNAALPTLHRYLRLRKSLLGISDDLRYFDNYPPIYAPAHRPQFTVEEAERLTLAALSPLGEEYVGLLRQGFAGRWMNAYPHEGKASGGYMNPLAYDVHPYLLLNFNGDYLSLSTLAHEWGHAVHTLLANRAQPFEKAAYAIFIAESASIGNEMLLSDYLIQHARDREQKLFYIGEALESIRGAFFRQAMFSEFELAIHGEIEQGRALSGQRMSEMYCTLLRKYYGEAQGVMKIDPAYCLEWAFVPHFYHGFYVYQYATSMSGAAYFTDAILKEGAPARARFLTLLRAGGSDHPYELYKRAGVDMAAPGPYRALIARMNRLLDEFEALISRKS